MYLTYHNQQEHFQHNTFYSAFNDFVVKISFFENEKIQKLNLFVYFSKLKKSCMNIK